MNTTTLLVDILIVGIQVLFWISGLVFSFLIKIEETTSLLKKQLHY